MKTSPKIFWAFTAIYLIWGSTYLGIQIGIETIPPFLLAGIRFFIAGVVLFLWARAQGEPTPPLAQWRTAAWLGTLFFVLGNGLVVWAELRVPSGLTALLASTSPIWTTVIESALAGWQRPPARIILGLVAGLAGLVLLASPDRSAGATQVPLLGVLGLVAASVAWSMGSVYSHRHHLTGSPAMATGMKMLGGGAQLVVLGLVLGEGNRFDPAKISLASALALLYLIVLGSIVGFTAFTFLLRVSTPALVSTSSYVNPVVAMFLGWALAGEQITTRTVLGAAIIIGGVILLRAPSRKPGSPGDHPDVISLDTGEIEVPRAPSPILLGRPKDQT